MKKETIKTEVLCIGGGPAGLMAAIRASDLGAKVVVADKCNTAHSGGGTAGCDHFQCYVPEYHGPDIQPIINEFLHDPRMGRITRFARPILEKSYDIIKLWDKWGIPMKYKGKWEFVGHNFPDKPCIHIRYSGGNQKQVLTQQALQRGVQIINRITVFELLCEGGRVTGALGYDTWNERLIEFQTKAVFIGTGACGRLYPSSIPSLMFNVPWYPFNSGDGSAMVYRVGAELCDMEFMQQWPGVQYFSRAGRAAWIGVLRSPDGRSVGPFINRPDRVYGDLTFICRPGVFDEYSRAGLGPIYMDCRGATKEDIEYMKHWLVNESNKGLLDYMAEEGIDPAKNELEFRNYGLGSNGGVWFNTRGETSLQGLFSTEFSGGMAFAAVCGWNAGESAAQFAKETDYINADSAKVTVNKWENQLLSILDRSEGASWTEANFALQKIMIDYAGLIRSEALLEQGLKNLKRLKEKVNVSIMARNGHELGRCLEVLNLIDLGEVTMLSARERKETRAKHNRPDYPFMNPMLDKFLCIKKVDNKPVFQWKQK